MRIDPHRLLVLDAVATTGSVTAAARRLHLVPSGVSQHLAALERELGVSLVDRSRRGGQRGIALTSAGRRLAVDAAEIRARLDKIEGDIARTTTAVQGEITVAAFPTVLDPVVLPARASLLSAYDAVRVRVVEVDQGSVHDALHAGGIDVALVEHESGRRPVRRGLAVRHLLDDPYVVAVPRDWPAPERLVNLGDRPWIEGPPDSVTATVLRRYRSASEAPFHAAHSCLEYPAVLDLVDAGLGAALVPELALRRHPARRARLLRLPGLGGRSVHVAYLRQRRERQVIRAFVEALEDAACELGPRADEASP